MFFNILYTFMIKLDFRILKLVLYYLYSQMSAIRKKT